MSWGVDCWWCAAGGRVQKCAGEGTVGGVQRGEGGEHLG